MSIHAIEKVFWEFGKNPRRIEDFMKDPDSYLVPYALDAEERRMIKENDLKALAEQGVSTLLTLMVWPLMNGPEGMPLDYLRHMGGEPPPGMVRVAPRAE